MTSQTKLTVSLVNAGKHGRGCSKLPSTICDPKFAPELDLSFYRRFLKEMIFAKRVAFLFLSIMAAILDPKWLPFWPKSIFSIILCKSVDIKTIKLWCEFQLNYTQVANCTGGTRQLIFWIFSTKMGLIRDKNKEIYTFLRFQLRFFCNALARGTL